MKKLNTILNGIDFIGQSDDRLIENISYDSRKVKNNSLFIAINGFKENGHNYIDNAINAGATAIITDKNYINKNSSVPFIKVEDSRKAMSKISANFFDDCSTNIKVTGITGTNGKTTITQIINHILNDNLKQSCALGTLGFQFQNDVKNTGFTTPESIELQQIFQTVHKAGISHLNMEVSSHSLSLNRVDNVDIDIAVFTNLTEEHLDFHKTMENYFHSKLKLFKNLSSEKLAIINNDDNYAKKFIESTKANILTYGFSNNSNIYASDIKLNLSGSEFNINYKNQKTKVRTHLIGDFNIMNILASILVCENLGIQINKIVKSLEKLKFIPGRFQSYESKNNGKIIVDYAHTPDAFEKILTLVKKIDSTKKIITLFGCGGDRDTSKRPIMGKISEMYSDKIILTNDNPRNESSNKIFDDIISGFKKSKHIIIKDRKAAIEKAVNNLSQNDTLLILGKGIENYQLIMGNKIYHNDIEIIKNLI